MPRSSSILFGKLDSKHKEETQKRGNKESFYISKVRQIKMQNQETTNQEKAKITQQFVKSIDKAYKKALANRSELFECRECKQKPSYLFKLEGSKRGFYLCREELDERVDLLVLMAPYLAMLASLLEEAFNFMVD